MKKLTFSLLATLLTFSSFSQKVVVQKSQYYQSFAEPDGLSFISPKLDLTPHPEVGTLYATIPGQTDKALLKLYEKIWTEANKAGANAYRVNKALSDSLGNFEVLLTLYFLDDEALKKSAALFPTNMIYLFGDLNPKPKKTSTLRWNDTLVELGGMHYLSAWNKIGGETKMYVGNVFGSSITIIGESNTPPVYLAVKALDVNVQPIMLTHSGPGIGLSFKGGRAYPLDPGFGEFLLLFLERKKVEGNVVTGR